MNSDPDANDWLGRPLSIGGAAVLSAVLGLGLAGCAQPSRQESKINSDTKMSIADIAASGGDTESARAILAAAAQSDPKNGELQLRYAMALLQSGRPDDAIGAARQAVQDSPRDGALAVRAAQLELRAGDPTLAATTFQSALGHGATGTPVLNGLGVARVQLGDLPGAEESFRRAVAVAPGDYAARNNLALALVLQGRADEAVPMLQSLADEPGVPDRVKHNLALAYAQQGDTRQAASVLSGVVSTSAVSREIAVFASLRSATPNVVASNFGPAEVMEGRTSGAAYAGTIPPRTVPTQPVMAQATPTQLAPPAHVATEAAPAPRPLPAEAKVAEVRPAPVAPVQATPIAPPASAIAAAAPIGTTASAAPANTSGSGAPANTAVASVSPAPLAPEPTLLSAQVVGDQLPNVVTPRQPAALAAVAAPPTEQSGAVAAPADLPASSGPTTTITITEPSDDGKIKVRIAAVPSRSAAIALWKNLAGLVPDLLDGRTPLVRMAKDHGHMAWRLGTGGFQDVAAAEQFCRQLRERGPNCTIGL